MLRSRVTSIFPCYRLLLLVLLLFTLNQNFLAQVQATLLQIDKPVTSVISANQTQHYQIDLVQGQLASVEFSSSGLSAGLKVLDSRGEAITAYGFQRTNPTRETIEIVAELTGHYQIDLESKSSDNIDQPYTIQLTSVRAASDHDLSAFNARRLHYQTSTLIAHNNFKEAVVVEEQVLKIREQTFGAEDPAVAESLEQLGAIYSRQAEYQKAEESFLRALKIREASAGPDSKQVFAVVNNLGALYFNMGDLDKAGELLQRALLLHQKLAGTEDMMKARVLNNLGLVYSNKGDYERAAPLYEQALAIEQKEFGPEGIELTDTLDNLAVLYQAKGDYLNSEKFSRRSLAIEEKVLGPDDPNLASTVLNLGNVSYLNGELDQAGPLYQRALTIYEKALGPEHPLTALALNNLAEVYHDRHEFSQAEPLYLSSLQIRKKMLGQDHSDVGQSLNNLGTLYRDEGDYGRAEQFYQRALKIREKALGPDHPDVVSTLSNMALMYIKSGNFSLAQAFQARAINTSERNASFNLTLGSERERQAYLDLMAEQLDRAISLNVRFAPEQDATRDLAVTTVLQRKGRIQDALSQSMVGLRTHMGPADLKVLDQFNEATSTLAQLVLGGPQNLNDTEFRKRIEQVSEQREQLEADVSRHSAEFRAQSFPVTLDAIKAALPDKAALIEFVLYHPLLPEGVTRKERYGPARYVVYVIRNQGAVQWKDLGEVKTVDALIEHLRSALRDPESKDVQRRARAVDQQLVQPIRALLDDATHLLISPDGELNLIPFGALVDDQGHYLINRYSFTYLTSGRDLLRMQVEHKSESRPVVFANPTFGDPQTVVAKVNFKSKLARRSVTTGKDLTDVYFAPLGGTAEEANSIHTLFPEAMVVTGAQATEVAIKQINAPLILHIATHGFFLSEQKPADSSSQVATRGINASVQIENPLLRSGLALSGANLRNGSGDDGILTALEASGLNLWGTKLVVLSACDTGVGEVRNGEGVYGLRRAFVLAGAGSLVMSLWPISDFTTRQLMTNYYKNLKQGLGRGEALRQVQLDMLKKNPNLHPFYWANFIQAGEWANLDGRR
ncbi:MAG TPA: CHAT domain-containing tetratricopeptide repeat protein [Pyrinomonadaceae bacterium]